MARRPHTPGARKRPRGTPRTPPPSYGRRAPEPDATDAPRLVASFETSAPDIARAPPDRGREVAFAGRSNAGKSSVLNRLAGQRGLARTSGTPGRTQLLNFFRIRGPEEPQDADGAGSDSERAGDGPDEELPRRLVDLPGYGYAKTNLQTRNAWQANVEEYLAARQTLVGVVLVMDIRHPFQPFDEHMVAWARASALPLLILLNKADKLGHGAAGGALAAARAHLVELPNVHVMLFSALRGAGAAEALALLREWLCLPPPDAGAREPGREPDQEPDAGFPDASRETPDENLRGQPGGAPPSAADGQD